MGPEDFDKLLAWLDPDRDRAGEKYEDIRRRLIQFFMGRGCWEPEVLFDTTVERITRRIDELFETYVGEPIRYFYGVARKVFQEWLNDHDHPPPPPPDPPSDPDPYYDALEFCLDLLPAEDREVAVAYYQERKQAKIVYRKNLAERRGMTVEGLRTRVHRIRKGLKQCILGRLDRQALTAL